MPSDERSSLAVRVDGVSSKELVTIAAGVAPAAFSCAAREITATGDGWKWSPAPSFELRVQRLLRPAAKLMHSRAVNSRGQGRSCGSPEPTLAGKVKKKAKVVDHLPRGNDGSNMRPGRRHRLARSVLAAREARGRLGPDEKEATIAALGRRRSTRRAAGELAHRPRDQCAGSKKSMGGGDAPAPASSTTDDAAARATTPATAGPRSGPSIPGRRADAAPSDDGAASCSRCARHAARRWCARRSPRLDEGGGDSMEDAARGAPTPPRPRASLSRIESVAGSKKSMGDDAAAVDNGGGGGRRRDAQGPRARRRRRQPRWQPRSSAVPGVGAPVLLTTDSVASGPASSSLGSSPSPSARARARVKAGPPLWGRRRRGSARAGHSPMPRSRRRRCRWRRGVRRTLSFEKKKKERGQRFVDEE